MSALPTLLTLLYLSLIRHFLPQPLTEAQHKWGIKLSFKCNPFVILFIVVPPSHSFFLLSTAASLSRQANYNQRLRSLADSQLCLICLFNFFLCWLTLVLSFLECSWWQDDMPYPCSVSASENTHLQKNK